MPRVLGADLPSGIILISRRDADIRPLLFEVESKITKERGTRQFIRRKQVCYQLDLQLAQALIVQGTFKKVVSLNQLSIDDVFVVPALELEALTFEKGLHFVEQGLAFVENDVR